MEKIIPQDDQKGGENNTRFTHDLYCAYVYCKAHPASTKTREKIKNGFLMGAYLQSKPFLSIECINVQKQYEGRCRTLYLRKEAFHNILHA